MLCLLGPGLRSEHPPSFGKGFPVISPRFAPGSAAYRTSPLCWLPNSRCRCGCPTVPRSHTYPQETRQRWNPPGAEERGLRRTPQELLSGNVALTPISIISNKVITGIANTECRVNEAVESTPNLCTSGAVQLPERRVPLLHPLPHPRSPRWAGKTCCCLRSR